MKNIFYKELKLVVPTALYILFSLLAALVIIPNYPYFVAFGYAILAIFITFSLARDNKDIEFTSMLPIPRNDIVKSKLFTILFLEGVQIVACIPFAILSALVINTGGNLVGLDANFTLFGFAFIEFGVFNFIFIPQFFKTGYKIGISVFWGLTGYMLVALLLEGLVIAIPVLHNILDGYNVENIGYQILVLLVGLGFYILSAFLSYKRAVKNFDKVNF